LRKLFGNVGLVTYGFSFEGAYTVGVGAIVAGILGCTGTTGCNTSGTIV